MIYSNCCFGEWLDGFCMTCYKPAYPMTECDECMGTGKVEVIDHYRVNAHTISPPYNILICEKCYGEGYIEIDYDGEMGKINV